MFLFSSLLYVSCIGIFEAEKTQSSTCFTLVMSSEYLYRLLQGNEKFLVSACWRT